jgi:hypothetical protein
MAAMPELEQPTVRAIYRLHEVARQSEQPRDYLGMSELGESCSRRLWYGWRWAGSPEFDGRMLRLFGSGHREEARLLDELRAIGLEVAGEQHEVEACGGHAKGHLDGMLRGMQEAPAAWHVFEAKTHNVKSFADVKAKGVRESKPKHYAQMQLYMGSTGVERAAYFAVCKDNDEIYLERVHFDRAEFDRLIVKAHAIIGAASPPPRISDDAAWYECRFCPHHALCHGATVTPPPNCRTCAHASPVEDGKWKCEHWEAEIPVDAQRTGCDEHRYIPALVPWLELADAGDDNVVVWRNTVNGANVRQPDYLSREIHRVTDRAFLGDDFVASIKSTFPGSEVVATRPVEVGDHPKSDIEDVYGPSDAGSGAAGVAKPPGRARRGSRGVRELPTS